MADIFHFKSTEVEWDTRHASILQDFLFNLETQGIKYVILKNDFGLPFENHSKDVDIVIQPGSYKCVSEILASSYKKGGITHYRVHKFEKLRCWYGFSLDKKFAIHIDLLEGFLHKGFEIFSFDMMYAHSYKNKNGIYVLDNIFANLILLLHSTICYHKIKDKYVERISEEYFKSKSQVDELIYKLFPRKAASSLIALLQKNDYDSIEKHGKWFSHQSKRKIIVRRPCFTVVNVLDFFWEKVKRIIINNSNYNAFLSVHAPDGTGKTTFIKRLSEKLGFYFVCDTKDLVRIYHFRPEYLPNLGAAGEKVGVMKQDKDFTNPHRAKPAGYLSSFIRMTYYWLDYVIGMPLILRKNAQFDTITIFDRYIYDFLVDPFRTRIKLPFSVRWTFAKLVKQPKIVFVLDADVETIFARKQELTREEISRQLKEFKKLKKIGSRVHILDATKTPDEITDDAIKIIVDRFANRL